MNTRVSIALIASALFAGVASAQSTQAVEWKVSEGGNGHWYGAVVMSEGVSWTSARVHAEAMGGHLATMASGSENNFCFSLIPPSHPVWAGTAVACETRCGGGPWLGAYQDRTAPDYSEPLGGWRWIDGTPWLFTAWYAPVTDNYNGYPEDYLHYWRPSLSGAWNDNENASDRSRGFIVEWQADCNSDGIVDYGQIRSGQLSDDNTNGIPDICETSITGVIPPSVPAQGGSAISINGRNFPAQPTVLVGGVPATNVVRVSETRLTATTPAVLPGMASVSVNGFTLADGIYIRPECGSDLDQDGEVSASDIAIVLLDFGPCYATATSSQPADSTRFLLKEEPVTGAAAPR